MRSRTEQMLAKVIWVVIKRLTPNTFYIAESFKPFNVVASETNKTMESMAAQTLIGSAYQRGCKQFYARFFNVHYEGEELDDWEIIIRKKDDD